MIIPKLRSVQIAAASLVLITVSFEDAFAKTAMDPYTPAFVGGSAQHFPATGDDHADGTIRILTDLEITGMDMTIRYSGDGCLVSVLRDVTDRPPDVGSSLNLFTHQSFASETLHYTFDPPVLVTTDMTLRVASDDEAVCDGQVGLRTRLH